MSANPPTGDKPDERPSELEAPLIYTTEELFQGRREVWIEHDGEMYRLRLTGKSKLLLTK